MPVVKIETFVFFDIKTTGSENHEIAEMAFVAIHKNSMRKSTITAGKLPRVVDKLVLCVDPGEENQFVDNRFTRADIRDSGKRPFDEYVGTLIAQFLERQAQPACLIAHNGSQYDFVILARKLASIPRAPLPDVRCGDSLKAFYEVLDERRYGHRPYSLPNLYKDTFKKCLEYHSAELFAVALMELVMNFNTGSHMRMWFDKNAVKKLSEYPNSPLPAIED